MERRIGGGSDGQHAEGTDNSFERQRVFYVVVMAATSVQPNLPANSDAGAPI